MLQTGANRQSTTIETKRSDHVVFPPCPPMAVVVEAVISVACTATGLWKGGLFTSAAMLGCWAVSSRACMLACSGCFCGVLARHPLIGLVSRACQSARSGCLLGDWLGHVRHLRPRAWAAVVVISGQGLGLLIFGSQRCLGASESLYQISGNEKVNKRVRAHLVHLTP